MTHHTYTLANLQAHFDALRIEHFGAHEVLSREFVTDAQGRRVKTRKRVLPPVEDWPNLDLTVLAADEIRRRVGLPTTCICGYRTLRYDLELGHKGDSQHIRFGAMDLGIAPEHMDALRAEATHVMERLHHEGYSTGLGHYRWGVHVDVNATKPGRRRWRFPRDLQI